MITFSPDLRPERITRSVLDQSSQLDRCAADDAVRARPHTAIWRVWSFTTLWSGNEHRLTGFDSKRRMCPNIPGVRKPVGSAPAPARESCPSPRRARCRRTRCALPAELGFVLQPDVDVVAERARLSLALVFQKRGLGSIEDETDRIERARWWSVLVAPASTRLPAASRWREICPSSGAATRVNSRLSSLACTLASPAATSAAACWACADKELEIGLR